MPTLVKIRGLERGDSAVASGSASAARGFRMPSGYGLAYPSGVKATATGGATTSALTVTAKQGGTYANGHVVNVSQAGAGTGTVTVALAAGTGVPTFTVTGAATMTSANAAAALNAHFGFASLYSAVGGGVGTTLVNPGALAAGTNVGTGQQFNVGVSSKTTAIVDMDDANTLKLLRRNLTRYISLGSA